MVSVLGLLALASAGQAAENGNLYVYALGQDSALWTVKKTQGQWGGWQRIGGEVKGGLGACSPEPGGNVVMLRSKMGLLNATVHNTLNGMGQFTAYRTVVGSDLGVACAAGGRMGLFVRGYDQAQAALFTTTADGGARANQYIVDQANNDHSMIGNVLTALGGTRTVNRHLWDGAQKAVTSRLFFKSGPEFFLGGWPLGGQIKGAPDGVILGGANTLRQAVFVRGMADDIW
ncbi:hypothetical protein [Deinococcus hopiensis]|uniref:hypothetical protein n=1 Tax=Deinococcus hopiensis TaxID=309885 RepID=UPI000A030BE4|nr:hypothetical protein [Deinococcus hopiensis]